MLIYITSRVVSCIAAFLYPIYPSFKTLSRRPAKEKNIKRWLMYWSVLACVIAVEHLTELLVSWILFKTPFHRLSPADTAPNMLIYLTSRVVSYIAAFLYPIYASFKTLSRRHVKQKDLKRWLMYWSVLACVIGVEYLAEWLISWIPFYYLFKMLFLLYIALPQTQGASYLYKTQLAPALRAHEAEIHAALAQLCMRVFAFVQAREWLVSWIPFYYPFKVLFVLYMDFPQTQRASDIYRTQLAPALRAEIRAALAQLLIRVLESVPAPQRMLLKSLLDFFVLRDVKSEVWSESSDTESEVWSD